MKAWRIVQRRVRQIEVITETNRTCIRVISAEYRIDVIPSTTRGLCRGKETDNVGHNSHRDGNSQRCPTEAPTRDPHPYRLSSKLIDVAIVRSSVPQTR